MTLHYYQQMQDTYSRKQMFSMKMQRKLEIWKSNTIYSLKTKFRLFNSNVISVLLYGCQNWRVSKDDMNKLDVFQTKCLRRTCNIFWPNKISHEDLYRRTNSSPISTQIQKHRLRWLGHVLRMPQDSVSEMDANRKT